MNSRNPNRTLLYIFWLSYNEKLWIYLVQNLIVNRRMDGQTNKPKPVYPYNFVGRGYKNTLWDVDVFFCKSWNFNVKKKYKKHIVRLWYLLFHTLARSTCGVKIWQTHILFHCLVFLNPFPLTIWIILNIQQWAWWKNPRDPHISVLKPFFL